jgi:polyisoprenoid-binding protein YceI
MKARLAIVLVMVAASGLPALAQSQVFELDAQQSRVTFTLPATMHTVHGSFALKSGKIQFDPASGAASGSIVLDAKSARTGNDGRDGKMHREILESDKYPEIVLTLRRLTGDVPPEGRSQVTLEGTITLHGASHPFSVSCSVEAHAGQVSGDASFVVPYVAWGLKNPSTFVLRVSDKVTLEVHAAGRISR